MDKMIHPLTHYRQKKKKKKKNEKIAKYAANSFPIHFRSSAATKQPTPFANRDFLPSISQG
jgi:hypothetical protein